MKSKAILFSKSIPIVIAIIVVSILLLLASATFISLEIKKSEDLIHRDITQLNRINTLRSSMAHLTMWQYTLRSENSSDKELALKEISKLTEQILHTVEQIHSEVIVDTLYTQRLKIAVKQLLTANQQIISAEEEYVSSIIVETLSIDYRSVFAIASFHVNSVEELTLNNSKQTAEQRYIRLVKYIMIGFIGAILVVILIVSTVFARKKAEKSLDEAKQYLTDLFNSMPSALIGLDSKGLIVRMNRAALLLSEIYGNESLYENKVGVLFPFLQDVFPDILKHLKSKENYSFELEDLQSDTIYQLNLFPLTGTGAVLRLDNITSQVKLEEQLRQTQKMNAIGQLAGGVAHDFNNMLGGIMNAAEFIRDGCTDEEKEIFTDIILNASDRAAELTQKLLSFARKKVQKEDKLLLHDSLRSSLDLLRHTVDKRVQFVLNLHAEKSAVIGDNSQLQNVFINLGINAGHAMPEGGTITFTTSVVDLNEKYCDNSPFDLKPGFYISVEIADSGTGIKAADLEHIFEPFFTTKTGGSGIGLASVYGTVQQHSGEITVESELGTGTTFRLSFPLIAGAVEEVKNNDLLVHGEGTILIVDDEPIMRKSLALILKKLGYTVLFAENGLDGVELFRENKETVDLIIMDMIMPVMKGDEALAKIRDFDKNIPVLISSGFSHSEDIERVRELSFQGIISKPYRASIMSQTIFDLISKS